MKKLLLLFVGLQAGAVLLKAGKNDPQPADYSGKAGQKTVCFEENKGQVHDQYNQLRPDVLFDGQDGDLVFHLKRDGISYQLNRVDSWKDAEDLRMRQITTGIGARKVPDQVTIYRLDVSWLNANTKALITPGHVIPSYNNYYAPTCPDGALNVRSCESLTYSGLYSGVDLKWYEKDGHLKYDYIVAPHADYRQIQLQVEGAEKIYINAQGELVIETPLGQIIEKAPVVMQGIRTLTSKWMVRSNIVSFSIEGINPNEQLIIDPAVRAWGTYYGGAGDETGYSCACDASGNVYMAGRTSTSAGVIATSGSHQVVFGGWEDAFFVKFNNAGVRQWGTYYGGSGDDAGTSCTVDGSGNVYLAGYTSSATGIATAGTHQSVIGGGDYNGFVAKFDAAGVRQWGTYYGGPGGFTDVSSCVIDANGNVYISGRTTVNGGYYITTIGSHQTVFGSSNTLFPDAFLAKFNSSGVRQWGTYYGGYGTDVPGSIALDANSNIYMSGYTNTSVGTAIATAGSYQSMSNDGICDDAFLVKFNSSGVRQWGTYYGDTQCDQGYGCAVDLNGNVYLCGGTASWEGIATPFSHQDSIGAIWPDGSAFLVKFDSSGFREWATYYGGPAGSHGAYCTTDGSGNIFMTGITRSGPGTVIATPGSQQVAYGGGAWDAYLVEFNSAGIRQWGTYYGGADEEWGNSCAADGNGNVFLAGYTGAASYTGIASPGAHQTIQGGLNDACLVKFRECIAINVSLGSQSNPGCFGDTDGAATIIASGGSGLTYSWSPIGGSSPTVSGLAAGSYTCTVTNSCGTLVTQIVTITQPPAITTSQTVSICNNDSLVVGPSVYHSSGTYTDVLTSVNGCDSTVTTNLTVAPTITASQTISICNNDSVVVGPSVYYSSGTYTDVLTSVNGCDSTVTTNLTVNPAAASSQTISICNNDSVVVGSSVYYSSGTYTDALTAVNGCDSTVTTNLTVHPAIDVTTTLISGITITANQSGASYQWINCNNGNQPIAGQTGQSFTATVNGNYAVIVTQNGCSDTSACVLVFSVGTNSLSPITAANIYPNPSATGDFILILDRASSIFITDVRGREVFAAKYEAGSGHLHLETLNDGIYFLLLHDATGMTTQKLIISR